jgi:AraC family transcriptional regulator, ethanolamine operon transcriptional activator
MNKAAEVPPVPRLVANTFSDFEEMEAALQVADVKLCQTRPSKFQGGLTTAAFDQSVLCVGWESVGHLTHSASPHGFILNLSAEDQFYCNGHSLRDGTMLLCRSGAEHMAHSTAAIRWAYLILPPERMERILAGLAAGGAVDIRGSCLPVRLAPDALQALRSCVCRVLSVLGTNPQILDDTQARAAMEQCVFEAFQEPLSEGNAQSGTESRDSLGRVVSRAQEYLREHLHGPVYMNDVGAAARVSERTLRNAFQALFGMSPNRYLKLLRMNAARRELHKADPGQAMVRDVALRFGFWDLSHFAVDYRELFGESPSQTLGTRRA